MGFFTRALVGLDLSGMDIAVIEYVRHLVKVDRDLEAIYFVHVVNDLELPEEIRQKYGEHLLPNDETIQQQMRQEVEKYGESFEGLEIHYEVLEGNPLKQLLHWAKVKLIDLIIAGKKEQHIGTGIVMEKLARKSTCSILFITSKQPPAFERILLPIDFSSRTGQVFEKSRELLRNVPNGRLLCLNVVNVPVGYYRIGKTFDEFAEIMIHNEQKRWEQYQKKHSLEDLPMEMHFEVNQESNIAKVIFDFAQRHGVNLIIMASKGQTDTSVLLLGSVAEKLISYDYDIPFLLIKQPGDLNDFFEAIKRL